MAELTLAPYAVVQRWTLQRAGLAPEVALQTYLETLAMKCQGVEKAVIGHLKALALFPGGQYLRVSAVAAHLPATVDGSAPPGCTGLEVTLNVLVYGLPAEQAAALTQACADFLMQKYPILIEILPNPEKGTAHPAHSPE